MSDPLHIVVLSGSARKDSVNQKLARVAANLVEGDDIKVTLVEWSDYQFPMYHGDLEAKQGMPEAAQKFKNLLISADALIVASPEYNSSVTPLLKNAIDWASRPAPDEPPLIAFRGKVAALMAASPGGLGGIRVLVHLRDILGNIGMHVLPDQVMISDAYSKFDESNNLTDEGKAAQVEKLVNNAIDLARRLKDEE